MDVSIIIVNYKTKDFAVNAIKSIQKQTVGITYEIIVVDNNSNDGSIEYIEQTIKNIIIIKNNKNVGFGVANNIGISRAKGKYVFCLNSDTILINNAIKILFDFMEQNLNVGACGGQLYNENNSLQISYGYFPSYFDSFIRRGLLKLFYFKPKKIKKHYKNVDFVIGADLFIRKSVLDKIGLFDSNIFMYGEETELCYRIKQFYDIVLIPTARIIHFGGKSSISNNIRELIINGEFYFVKKHKVMPILFLKVYYLLKYSLCFFITFNKSYINSLFYVLRKY